jgi:hypothetical protein
MLRLLGLRLKNGWLVGRWNGRSIEGIEIHFKFFFRKWGLRPYYSRWANNSLRWLCFWISVSWNYGTFIKDLEE